MKARETLGSRLGFLLVSAGCAIGLGNIWRFPFIAGMYGGGIFVLIYLLFLVILGWPAMVMEFAIGRGSGKSLACAIHKLEPAGTKWHWYSKFGIAGNYLLMMFYTVIAGWIFYYFYAAVTGKLTGLSAAEVETFFTDTISDPVLQIGWMAAVVILGFLICRIGLRRGVERITNFMMSGMFIIMMILAVKAVSLPGAAAGVKFYLLPDISRMAENGIWNTIYAAMGQAFFTLSLGIGAMMVFGSYIDRSRSLAGESMNIMVLDTMVALIAGLIIIPSSMAFGVNPGAGPSLIFITLPNVFNHMIFSRFWISVFFLFMCCAAFTTVVAVFENIVAFMVDCGFSRKNAAVVNIILIILLSVPCALGFNVWSGFQPLGSGTNVLDLEDFIVSNNLLPLGSLIFVMFCCSRKGWGMDDFFAEADAGSGIKFPKNRFIRIYLKYIFPCIMLTVFIGGYIEKISAMLR
ncbi:MAG: sodium-dependent transporter [Spirochaetia bacterium]|nr:sodium-dependent transporter [Spirochaetia bacterium]